MSTHSSPLTRAVTAAMQKLYPDALADKSFDNTGLLLDAPQSSTPCPKVLLTIDLTTAVADEAIATNAGVIVAYHPIIFRALKSLSQSDTQQRTLLRLAAHGTSVYCPHTAVDAALGGNADWLADILTHLPPDIYDRSTPAPTDSLAYALGALTRYRFPSPAAWSPNSAVRIPHVRAPVIPTTAKDQDGAGMGRTATFHRPKALPVLLRILAQALGNPKAFSMSLPPDASLESTQIRRVAVCAGSGASVLGNVPPFEGDADGSRDLWVTGELAHHEALAARERGIVVVCLGHSNSERAYLTHVMRGKLEEALRQETGQAVEVLVSEKDEDPLSTVVLETTGAR